MSVMRNPRPCCPECLGAGTDRDGRRCVECDGSGRDRPDPWDAVEDEEPEPVLTGDGRYYRWRGESAPRRREEICEPRPLRHPPGTVRDYLLGLAGLRRTRWEQ